MYKIRCLLLPFFIFSFFVLQVFSYDSGKIEIDESQKMLNGLQGKQKGQELLKKCKLYRSIEPQKSIKFGKEAIENLRIYNPAGLPDAYINIAIGYFYKGENDTVKYYLDTLLKAGEWQLTKKQLGAIYNILSVVYREKGMYDTALRYSEISLKQYELLQDSLHIAAIIDNMSSIYNETGDYEEALSSSLTSLRVFENMNSLNDVAIAHFKIADIYANLKNYNETGKHLFISMDIAKRLNDFYLLSDINNNLGTLYEQTGKTDSAEYYYREALKFYNKNSVESGIATVYQNLGSLLKNSGRYDESISYLILAYDIFLKNDKQADLLDLMNDLVLVYAGMGAFDTAEIYLNRADSLSRMLDNPNLRMKTLKTFKDYYLLHKKYEQAYNYFVGFINLKDSLNNVKVKQQIAELDKRYQMKKKEEKIEKLKNEKLNQQIYFRTLFLILGFTILIVIAGLYFVNVLRKKEKSLLLLEKEKVVLQNRELAQELEYANRQLTTEAINIAHRNKMLMNFLKILNNYEKVENPEQTRQLIYHLKKEIERILQSESQWEQFDKSFAKINRDFEKKFKDICPLITNNDYRIASLIKLGMTNKEIATLFNISPQSVKNSLYRMKKKIKNKTDESIRSIIRNL